MNWEALGAIAELVGAIGVIATLGYLAMQIRQNTMAQRSASRLETTRAFTEWYTVVMTEPELMKVWTKVFIDGSELSDEDRTKFVWMISAMSSRIEEMFTQNRAGLIEDTVWNEYRGTMAAFLEVDVVRQWWESGATTFSNEFRQEIESTKQYQQTWKAANVGEAIRN